MASSGVAVGGALGAGLGVAVGTLVMVAVAVVAHAVWGMARRLCPDAPRRTLAALAAAIATAMKEGKLVNWGGRVLGVTALGETTADAQKLAYEAVNKITWRDCYCRTDIAAKAIAGGKK